MALENECAELSILYAPRVSSVRTLPDNLAGENKSRLSVVIGQAGSGVADELYRDADNAGKSSVSGLGVALGPVSYTHLFPVPAHGNILRARPVVEVVTPADHLSHGTLTDKSAEAPEGGLSLIHISSRR